MCGIFAYIGNKQNASQIVLKGLKSLEYRGYDSWGIASQANTENNKPKKILIQKHTGKIGNSTLNPKLQTPNSLSIGHTRWATHGGVTNTNAHPHFDCTEQIAVLHNGIIENFQGLKKDLLKKGHKIISETDTEIISHLIEENIKLNDFKTSLLQTFKQLKGLNAIVAINTENNEIIAAKNGSPLVAGIGKDELFLASDAAGILPYTKKVIFLKDNELISLGNSPLEGWLAKPDGVDNYNQIKLYSLKNGKELKPQIETINWIPKASSKGKFQHFMLKEIHEQPAILARIASNLPDQIIKEICETIKKAKDTYLLGCGTAYHACLAGTYLFSKIAKTHINTAPASQFNYLENFLTKDSLIIPLSQSGETIDVIEPISHAQKKGSKIIAITNTLGSTIYRMGDHKLLLEAGPEKAVASTKAYLAKISILTLLAHALANQLQTGKQILNSSSKEIKRLLDKKSLTHIKNIAKLLSKKDHIYIIGRGTSHATALEGALKIKEVSYIHAEGLSGGELKHGSIALISKGTPTIVIAPQDETYDAIISNAIEIKSRGGLIIGISSKNNPAFDQWIEVRETNSPLLTHIIPMQLLAYYLAVIKNLDPDSPRNLAKSVTVK
jgi:glucosamine--fructose-6-phosphate aminotransferase (isomerizing)